MTNRDCGGSLTEGEGEMSGVQCVGGGGMHHVLRKWQVSVWRASMPRMKSEGARHTAQHTAHSTQHTAHSTPQHTTAHSTPQHTTAHPNYVCAVVDKLDRCRYPSGEDNMGWGVGSEERRARARERERTVWAPRVVDPPASGTYPAVCPGLAPCQCHSKSIPGQQIH